MNDNILLSICIPTYNRADTLSRTLEELFTHPDFDAAKIEVVVSDNASTDHTAEVVARYPSVRYYRNETNIGGNPNFTAVLNRGRGKYLRLMNDTARFNEGMLGKMLRKIEETDQTRENLYFANPLPWTKRKEKEYVVHGKNEFIGMISFFITWIGNFGMWRTDFEKIENKDRFVETLLHQVDWTLHMAGNGRKTKVFVDDLMQVEDVKNKGSYDVFNIFITNFLYILKCHKINFFRMKIEKFKLFAFFVLPRLNRINEHSVDMSNRSVVYKRYWYEPYYLPLRLVFPLLHKIF